MARPPSPPPGPGDRRSSRVLKGLAYAALLGLLALIVAVAVATAYLPSYADLTRSAPTSGR